MTTNKELIQEQLAAGPVIVTFTKKDGTRRIMPCTTNPTIIMFKNGGTTNEYSDLSGSAAVVFDLEKNSWRSFRWDSVVETELV